ncbi:MAG: chloramphenicol acetyltransferase [Candidatus Izemoplasmatales bacterium]|nr:chloramphenicol acetyltransferase [Candidatus Izemoplasmatales bacterium]
MEIIDMARWKRRKHYALFKDYDMPHFSLTAEVDITPLYRIIKAQKKSFFATFLHTVMTALNHIPEFRTRIRGEEVVIHDVVHPSYTVLTDDDLFSFVTTDYHEDPVLFCRMVDEDIHQAKLSKSLEDVKEKDDLIYISAIPWVTFTSLTHPFSTQKMDSIPRISWGRFYPDGDRYKIPIAISAHHALLDGVHVGKFFNLLRGLIEDFH